MEIKLDGLYSVCIHIFGISANYNFFAIFTAILFPFLLDSLHKLFLVLNEGRWHGAAISISFFTEA